MSQNTKQQSKIHADLALAIKAAKRKLFKEHREGASLRQATTGFIDRCHREFEAIESLQATPFPPDHPVSDHNSELNQRAEVMIRKQRIKPLTGTAYASAMRDLGLDWTTIDSLAGIMVNTGDDEHLIVMIVLIGRLAQLANMEEAPETLDNYLPLLRNRLYRFTYNCEEVADQFYETADADLRKGGAA